MTKTAAKHGSLLGWFLFLMPAVALLAQTSADDSLSAVAMNDRWGTLFHATSTLEDAGPHVLGTYGMQALFDGNGYTGWSEGEPGRGVGTVLWVDMDTEADTLLIRNGFARTSRLFGYNNRVREIELSLWYGYLPSGMVTERASLYILTQRSREYTVAVDDTMEIQEITLPFTPAERLRPGTSVESDIDRFLEARGFPQEIDATRAFLRIKLVDTYPGTRWDDTCLTELRVYSARDFEAMSVYSDDGAMVYDTATRRGARLYSDRQYLYEPITTDDGGRWSVSIRTPRQAEGRVQTTYTLFHLPYPEPQEPPEFEEQINRGAVPIEFIRSAETLSLRFDSGAEIVLDEWKTDD